MTLGLDIFRLKPERTKNLFFWQMLLDMYLSMNREAGEQTRARNNNQPTSQKRGEQIEREI